MNNGIYDYIETYEGVESTLECVIAELESAPTDPHLNAAIAALIKAKAVIRQYEGKIRKD